MDVLQLTTLWSVSGVGFSVEAPSKLSRGEEYFSADRGAVDINGGFAPCKDVEGSLLWCMASILGLFVGKTKVFGC